MQKKVLICDDDPDILSICTLVLKRQGFEVITSSHCNNIVPLVEEVKPDVIFMDNWIPDDGGIVASKKIKESEALKHIPIVYFSANNEIKSLAQKAGAEAFLSKPFDLGDLEKVIDSVLVK